MDSPFPPLSSLSTALFLYLINQTAIKIAARAPILDSTAAVMTPANKMKKRIAFTPLNTINYWEEISKPHQLHFLAVESLWESMCQFAYHYLKFNYINFSVNFKSEGWFSIDTESELLG